MTASSVLVTGGAGYIGSHTVRLLSDRGYKVVVIDNLVYGHRKAIISPEVSFYQGEIGDEVLLDQIFRDHSIDVVMHFAAYAYVGESVEDPAKYYRNNVEAPLALLDAMRENQCKKFIFSSTCATYGNPQYMPIDEKHPQAPINPYGQSKLMLEKILVDYVKAYDFRCAFLRYFNACGAYPDGLIGEDHDPETHLIPLVLMTAAGLRENITVYGTDYNTPDGTCIRDYIHVMDLAEAHIAALNHLRQGGDSLACNLGTGTGASVKEVIAACKKVTGKKIKVEYGPRRAGDPSELVANPAFAKEALDWEAKHKDLQGIVESAWKWMTGPNAGRYK